jgi:hypothetical protein
MANPHIPTPIEPINLHRIPPGLRVLVCGGRDFTNRAFVWSALARLHAATPFAAIIQGGAAGADALAAEWARTKPKIERYVCKADWATYGRSAGAKRNARMLEWKPDFVVAFPGGKGTANMVAQATAAGIQVLEIA